MQLSPFLDPHLSISSVHRCILKLMKNKKRQQTLNEMGTFDPSGFLKRLGIFFFFFRPMQLVKRDIITASCLSQNSQINVCWNLARLVFSSFCTYWTWVKWPLSSSLILPFYSCLLPSLITQSSSQQRSTSCAVWQKMYKTPSMAKERKEE